MGFFEFVLVSASVSARQKGGSGPSVSASKNSVPDSDVRDRFDDWVVGLQFVPDYLHHPVSANRVFPTLRRIGRFCGDFWPLISQILVSVGVHASRPGFWVPCLRIQKFRSRRPALSRLRSAKSPKPLWLTSRARMNNVLMKTERPAPLPTSRLDRERKSTVLCL